MKELIPQKWNPEDYERNSSSQEKWADALISGLELNGNERILDIGCGNGKITAKMAARVPDGQVLGIGSSQDIIDGLTDPQKVIYEYIKLKGKARGMDLVEKFKLSPTDMGNQFAVLRHCQHLKGYFGGLSPS